MLDSFYEKEFQFVDWNKAKQLFTASGIIKLILKCQDTNPDFLENGRNKGNMILWLPSHKSLPKPMVKKEKEKPSMSKHNKKTMLQNFTINFKKDPGPQHQCDTQLRLRNRSNPFQGTVLDRVVSFHWRPCYKQWQFPQGSENHTLLSTPL